MVYSYYNELQNLVPTMNKGNFGLWYNKFIPIKDFDFCKLSDEKGNENNAVSYYYDKYKVIQKDTINKLLDKKHKDQESFCSALSSGYETVIFKAKLITPLITGIGETHPHEVSMVFDHNMGIPYIPASGVKGIIRFAHTLGLLDRIAPEKIKIDEKSGQAYFDDEESWTNVPKLFGTQADRGSVIFFDAYSEQVPNLQIDIMNPHYGKYYNGEAPPADYLDPNPIKFLTVAKDTVFVFRALVDRKIAGLLDQVKDAFNKALTQEGVGAKTAVGYGLFEIISDKSKATFPEVIHGDQAEKELLQEEKQIDKFIAKLKPLKSTDAGPIGTIINDALSRLESEEDKKLFAQAVKAHMGSFFRKSKARDRLKAFLG